MPSRRAFIKLWPCSTLLATAPGYVNASLAFGLPAQASFSLARPAAWTAAPAPASSIPDPSLAWLASAILHEAVHQDQANRDDPEFGLVAEHTASAIQQQWLDRIGINLDVYRTQAALKQDFPDAPTG